MVGLVRPSATCLVMLLLLGLEPGITDAGQKRTIGAVEEVALPAVRLTLRARVDTGAALSSVGARGRLEVRLTARSRLEHPVLLGRNLLEGRFVVDVARRYTSPPACP